ncbi:hypothetical protein H7X46_07760 [Pseudonocardia sp. C8]|uniref:hypothetical protein n=1 Tax=Pseudonocardia sp. C8 TaxID=2762759 RepID=UPI0016423CC6|nr:hypothetical protein [Pseudonocardia sp. C8]MBC3190957.1 hypothetical protein [Pseudonocardia sp. C8]
MAYIIDTALDGKGKYSGSAYFFRDSRYVRYGWKEGRAIAGPTGLTAWNLRAPFSSGVDAAINGRAEYEGYGYFFRGDQYVSYNWSTGATTQAASLKLWNLPAGFVSGIDAALNGFGPFAEWAYFFRDDQYVRYRWATEAAAGPFPLSEWNLMGLFRNGVHAAVNGEASFIGKAYLFRGPRYVSYDWASGQVDRESHIDLWNLRGSVGA